MEDRKIHDIGAVRSDGSIFHSSSVGDLNDFSKDADFVCGHNILHHDLPFITEKLGHCFPAKVIDTLYLSPLLFPKKPYHSLLKNDKLQSDELNNPVNDCKKTERLLSDEVNAFYALNTKLRQTYCCLLYPFPEFQGFFDFVHFKPYLLYIGDFIRELQKKKTDKKTIPVSCFTATAKQKVISDICDYFKRKLDLNLQIYASTAARENLHYVVLYKETDEKNTLPFTL